MVRFNLASIYYRPSVLSLNSVSSHPSGQFLRSPSTLMKAVLCPSRRAVGIRPPSVAPSLWCKDSTFILIYATLLTRNFEGLLKKVLKTPLQRSVGHILRMKIFAFIFQETALSRGINRWGRGPAPISYPLSRPRPTTTACPSYSRHCALQTTIRSVK